MSHRIFNNQPSAEAIQEAIAGFGAWLEIDLDAITFNLKQVRARIGDGVEVMPVMKNDAYGHGLVPMVAHLHDLGCQRLMVAKLWEAFALRRAVPECECALKAFADRAGWMVYSVLNHLNLLLPRVYTRAGKPVALLDRATQLYGL